MRSLCIYIYIKELMKIFNRDKGKSMSTPIYPFKVFDVDENREKVSAKIYDALAFDHGPRLNIFILDLPKK